MFKFMQTLKTSKFAIFILAYIVMELRVGNRYRLGRKIGSGSFGDIYLGKDFKIITSMTLAIPSK